MKRATVYSILSTILALAAIYALIPRFGSSALPLGLIIGFVPFIFCGNIVESCLILRRAFAHGGGAAPAAPLAMAEPGKV